MVYFESQMLLIASGIHHDRPAVPDHVRDANPQPFADSRGDMSHENAG